MEEFGKKTARETHRHLSFIRMSSSITVDGKLVSSPDTQYVLLAYKHAKDGKKSPLAGPYPHKTSHPLLCSTETIPLLPVMYQRVQTMHVR